MGEIWLNTKTQDSTLHDKGNDVLGTYYIADNPKYYEPQRSNTFKFYVEGLTDTFKGNENFDNKYARENADKVLEISVNSTSVPHFTISALTLKRGNNSMKFAGIPDIGAGQITLTDFIGAGTKDILLAWQRQAYDPNTEKVGLSGDYKRTGYLVEYTPEFQVVRTWKLHGCWISGLSEDPYSHESGSGMKNIKADLQYDKATVDSVDILQ